MWSEMRAKSRLTPWFLAKTAGRMELTLTETGKSGRKMFQEKYQNFGFEMFIGIQVEISGRQLDIKI